MRIAIDTGGTFTDCVFEREGQLCALKVCSTPRDPTQSILSVLRSIGASKQSLLRHGTTVGTNTLLERNGARVALVSTEGFEDVIAIGRQARPSLYDWFDGPLPPLVPEKLRFRIRERIASSGEILRRPGARELRRLAGLLRASKAEAVAVCLLFSFANPANERAVETALHGLGLPLSVSHRLLPEFREYERASNCAVNAYLAPIMGSYLARLETAARKEIPGARVSVMQSSGGIIAARAAAQEPVRTILSGPAGGVVGACDVARRAGIERIITFDMGGTSTDVALVDGVGSGPVTTRESEVAGMPVAVPMLSIHTVGAGGGSLARFDAGGALEVGPESAGADPGPICYGHGVTPTVTDANLLLGRIGPECFLEGGLKLDAVRTRDYFDENRGLMTDFKALAAGIVRVVEASMERGMRVVSMERGFDPRDFTLVAFGGSGPLHACALAASLRIPRVLIPRLPGALSALGILISDAVRDYSRTVMVLPGSAEIVRAFLELTRRGARDMRREGLTAIAVRSVDVRYAGQGYEIEVPWTKDYVSRFHRAHRGRYGYADEQWPIEVVNARVRMIARAEPLRLRRRPLHPGDGRTAIVGKRPVFFHRAFERVPVYDRARLQPGARIAGPAVIAEYSATTVVPPGCIARVDEWANLAINIVAKPLSARH